MTQLQPVMQSLVDLSFSHPGMHGTDPCKGDPQRVV
jgi:hypothetical protein